MDVKFLGVPMFVWSGLCLLVAVVFAFLWPSDRAIGVSGLQLFLLRWGHSLVWLLLAVSCLVRGLGATGPANLIALLAGLSYAAFVLVLVRAR